MAELYEVVTGGQSSSQQVQIMSIELTRRMMEPEVNGAKYKAVDQRKLPVAVSMPSRKREPYKPLPIPLIPKLPHHPPKWTDEPYTPRLSEEQMKFILAGIQPGFLSEDKISLLIWVLRKNEKAIAFDDSERGCFKEEYFPDYIIETVPHTPWLIRPIRVPESVKEEMNDMLRDQKENGNLKTCESSYRSRMFVVQKPKGGLRIVHDLQPLNLVSVQDAMLPPNVSEFAEDFIGYAIYGTMDLYSGYHQRRLHQDSRALTATWSPNLGTVQLTSLPMGYTNSMQEFQRATNHIVYNMGTKKAQSFVDNIGAKGPKTRYNDNSIPLNSRIRRFVWEYAHTLYEVLATLIVAGATASGKKLVLAAEKVNIVGHICLLQGIRPHHGIVTKVMNWLIPINVTGV